MAATGCRVRATAFLLALLLVIAAPACTAPPPDSRDAAPQAWPVFSTTREGPGEEIGKITLTDPAGGPPRPARIGSHGIRIVLHALERDGGADAETSGARIPDAADLADVPKEVRIIYSREGSADTRAFVAVKAPGEPGVYLGTVDLVAAGEWRIRVSIVGAGGGSAQISVPES